jgi:serine/threonine protein kinase/tetratricopeptide (TPR) repeat protein
MLLTPGSRLGTYEILAPLGAGGMGEVYRAKDLRLGREVALKVLPAEMSASPDRLARFEREARAVAGLNHPNIVTLFSVEDDGDIRFLTMELVDGQSLDQVLKPGGLPIPRVIELGIGLADALAAAHEKGVVHRDLKPANVVLTKDGRVKVLDFGLAKLAAPDSHSELTQAATLAATLSSAGLVVGTVPYMAPEQVRGESVDARTDLFALGVVLYELASGKRPFAGSTHADISSAILRDSPESLASMRHDVPADLERIVVRCLEKNPRERMQTSLDVSNELRRLQRELERSKSGLPGTPAAERTATIAVLPFANRSRDDNDEYFSDGLADELLNVLAKIKGLRVTARTSSFHFKGKDVTIAEIGKALGVASVLEGSVRKAGDRARISVQLVRVSDSSHLWSETYDRTLDDIFAVQDDIAQSVVKELRVTLLGEKADSQAVRELRTGQSLAPEHSADPEAYDLYLRGRHQLNRRDDVSMHRAIEFLGTALARDPSYALAELGVAEAHALLGFHEFEAPREAFTRARVAAHRALELQPDLGEAHALLGYVILHHDRQWEASEREFLRAIELNPHHALTRLWYLNVLLAGGRFDEALEQGRRALELDPLSIINSLVTGWVHFFERRYDVAYEKMGRALELEPAFFLGHQWRGWALWQMGRLEEAAEELETGARLTQHPPTVLGHRAIAAALRGRPDECRELLARMIAMRDERFVSGFLIALGFVAAGDLDAAEPWIVRAADERSPWAGYLNVDPRVAALLDRPSIQAILARLGRGV